LASLQAVTLRESPYASFPDDYPSKQGNNVFVIQNECMTSHIIVCEKLGNFPLECDRSFSRHNQTPFSGPNPPRPRALLAQQLRPLGDIHRNPSRFIARGFRFKSRATTAATSPY
jgi:hypothetical protein